LDSKVWSLAALGLDLQNPDDRWAHVPGSDAKVAALVKACETFQDVAVRLLRAALEGAAAQLGGVPGKCFVDDVVEQNVLWLSEASSWKSVVSDNEVEAALGSISSVLARHTVQLRHDIHSIDACSWQSLRDVAIRVARRQRLMMENAMVWLTLKGIATNTLPYLREQWPQHMYEQGIGPFPTLLWADRYGRHYDVLAGFLTELQDSAPHRPLRVAEVGVACAGVGVFLLDRFSTMEYVGVDPGIQPVVLQRVARYGSRARLYQNISEEIAPLYDDDHFDLVFLDGPHTYANVRNDLVHWHRKVRVGGVLSGHDFTAQHPPLLMAVIEWRLGQFVRHTMDGVWWWTRED